MSQKQIKTFRLLIQEDEGGGEEETVPATNEDGQQKPPTWQITGIELGPDSQKTLAYKVTESGLFNEIHWVLGTCRD